MGKTKAEVIRPVPPPTNKKRPQRWALAKRPKVRFLPPLTPSAS
jgi:hypothetical protein